MSRTSMASGTAGALTKLIDFGGDMARLLETQIFLKLLNAHHLTTRDPDVGPRFQFLADSIRQNQSAQLICCNILRWESWTGWAPWVWQGRRRGWRTRSTSSTSTSPSLATSRYQPLSIRIQANQWKCHNWRNPRWGWGRSKLTWREGLRWEIFSKNLQRSRFSGESLPPHAWPQHWAGAHQHQGLHWTFHFCWWVNNSQEAEGDEKAEVVVSLSSNPPFFWTAKISTQYIASLY